MEDLKAYAGKIQLTNLTWVPFQSRDGVKQIMNITDANFICYQPVKILETGSPNKYFDGLAAGKLTIVNFGGWVEEEIRLTSTTSLSRLSGVAVSSVAPAMSAGMSVRRSRASKKASERQGLCERGASECERIDSAEGASPGSGIIGTRRAVPATAKPSA